MRTLTTKELELVAGAGMRTEDQGISWDMGYNDYSMWNGFDVTIGSTSNGWDFGLSYDNGNFGIWTESPNNDYSLHLFEDGSGSFNYQSGDSPNMSFDVDWSGSGDWSAGVTWTWEF